MKITVPEYANREQISKQAVYARIKRGGLKSIKENGTIFIILPDQLPDNNSTFTDPSQNLKEVGPDETIISKEKLNEINKTTDKLMNKLNKVKLKLNNKSIRYQFIKDENKDLRDRIGKLEKRIDKLEQMIDTKEEYIADKLLPLLEIKAKSFRTNKTEEDQSTETIDAEVIKPKKKDRKKDKKKKKS